jgi:hypothetical protein
MSFYTEPESFAFVGKKGDWVRLVVSPSFHGSPGHEFVSQPFQLPEGSPKHCPKECVAIRSLKFCEPLSAGKRNNAPPGACQKLEAWRDRRGSPHPATVDVMLEIQNTDDHITGTDDFVALTTTDSLIAPTNSYGLADLDKMRTTVGWAREDDLKMASIKWLKGGETRSIRISGFDIQGLLKFFADDPSSLWPWWIRVNLRIEDRDGDRVATGDVALPLIPTDKRLAGKSHEPADEDFNLIKRKVIAPKPRHFW